MNATILFQNDAATKTVVTAVDMAEHTQSCIYCGTETQDSTACNECLVKVFEDIE
jgi:hypothetical protein